MRYRFIEEHRRNYPIKVLCQTLEISVSGYYAWKKRPMSAHQKEDGLLAERIEAVYQTNRYVYGSPRVHAELHAQRIRCLCKRIARLMHERGLSARRSRHRVITTRSEPGARMAPNLLARDFTATRPNEKWTGDVTAVWTSEGWFYLAVVLDLFSRRWLAGQ